MAVSVETLEGLGRKIIVSVPNEKLVEEVDSRLKKLMQTAKIDGFRPGKVPFSVIKKRYSQAVRYEVMKDKIQSSLYEALSEKELFPAGTPDVTPQSFEEGQDLVYSAEFEVYPEFVINELDGDDVTIFTSEVTDSDVDEMLEKLRKQSKEWKEVSREVRNEDKVIIDFVGSINDEEFEGGKGEDFALELGANTMIPGFEDGIIGAKKDEEVEVKVTFPAEYNHPDLAGKDAVFKVNVKNIMQAELPNLDDDFAKNFNIQEGGLEALRKDIKENMVRELDRAISSKNRDSIFDAILEKNTFLLPGALVDKEIEYLKHEMYHRIFGHEHSDNEKIPDFPRELFEERAKKRVKLGILITDYVKKHEIKVDTGRVDAMIDKLAGAYEKPEEIHAWYKNDENRLHEIEGLVLEEMVADKMLANANIVSAVLTYKDAMNPEKDKEAKGA